MLQVQSPAKLYTVGTVRMESLGTNTTNTNIMTTDASGNVTTRTMGSLLESAVLAISPITATTTANDVTLALTRNNLNSGTSLSTATSPLTITNGSNTVVNGADTSLTVNNTAPLWNSNQLQGVNITLTSLATGNIAILRI